MKRSLYFNLLCVGLALAVGGVGCKNKIKNPTPIPGAGAARGPASNEDPFGPGGVPPVRTGDQGTSTANPNQNPFGQGTDGQGTGGVPLFTGELKPDPEFFKSSTVYFAFDRSDVRPGERTKIETVASHLKSNPTHKVRVEGHCDERGTEGYNLALGERRALAVREYLINLGVAADRVATLSYTARRVRRMPATPSPPGRRTAGTSSSF